MCHRVSAFGRERVLDPCEIVRHERRTKFFGCLDVEILVQVDCDLGFVADFGGDCVDEFPLVFGIGAVEVAGERVDLASRGNVEIEFDEFELVVNRRPGRAGIRGRFVRIGRLFL